MTFVVYAPRYDENIGGAIVLHNLCNLLNKSGEKAYLWPSGKPARLHGGFIYWALRSVAYYLSRVYRKKFSIKEDYVTPLATQKLLRDAIVIYPEVTSGNPLGVSKVVRWLLHKPRFHTGNAEFGSNELYFYFQEAFDDPSLLLNCGGRLTILEYFLDTYQQRNYSPRTGTCYIVRKGAVRKDLPNTSNLLVVDDLSHCELADIFNQFKYCVSYDMHTLYTSYAALCGCIPVIVPIAGLSKEEWQPLEELRYGLAYGFDDIEFALNTRHLLIEKVKKTEIENFENIYNFITKVGSYYNHG